jgi:hypothetical protein
MLRRPDRASSQHGRKVCDSDITSDGLTRRIHYQILKSSLASVLYRSFLFGNFPVPTTEPWRVWQNEKTPVEDFFVFRIVGRKAAILGD